ncbi:pyridoxal-phosphate dependent enzyme [Streptomyces axinellae]|uniref:Pyridoxal-phosphate dependent enzyme n=1 Tax=Streptomyces axinellae TaxID=552788 RepID=A0ABP6C0Y0_9ACTN
MANDSASTAGSPAETAATTENDGTAANAATAENAGTAETAAPVITLEDVRAAAARLEGVAHRTPVVRSRTLDGLVGSEVFLKCENFQRIGAFKFRGAYNSLAQLSPEQLARGVAAYSSGNHAQAVALAARELGTSAVIVMPEDTPAVKRAATEGYGARVITYDRYTQDRAAIGAKVAEEEGRALIPPYEHPPVMAGQGTTALELLEDVPDLDAMVVPLGGGGLMAGAATAATALRPGIRMIGVEPEDGDDTARSLAAGHRVRIEVPRGLADGQAAPTPGELTFSVNRRLMESVALVSDDEIRSAMRFAFERLKMLIEPSGATGLAALLAGRVENPPERVGVIISGGNIGLERFIEVMG